MPAFVELLISLTRCHPMNGTVKRAKEQRVGRWKGVGAVVEGESHRQYRKEWITVKLWSAESGREVEDKVVQPGEGITERNAEQQAKSRVQSQKEKGEER